MKNVVVTVVALLVSACNNAGSSGGSGANAPNAPVSGEAAAPSSGAASNASSGGQPTSCTHRATQQKVEGVLTCEDACKPRDGNCFHGNTCLKACQDGWASWDDSSRSKFFACTVCDPLCHRSVDDCMAE
ncbi:MAG: hypothetical protein R3B13_17020 [Polyangiaceae bacterium]